VSVVDGSAALAPEAGDEAARLKRIHDEEFSAFAEDSYHTVEGILRAWCFDRDVVKDALHEAYLHGRVKWPVIRDYREPAGWIVTTARNKILNERDRRRRETATRPEGLDRAARQDPTEAWEAQDILRDWLQQLPPRQAEVFQMDRAGFSNREIALILGIADISVRSYKVAARQHLRRLAEAAGYTDSDGRRRTGDIHGPR
jgi:RNA polymerase sigma factor (sigma-70 family)